ncbi:Histidine protein methyltransferase 1 homolog [Linum perenne]
MCSSAFSGGETFGWYFRDPQQVVEALCGYIKVAAFGGRCSDWSDETARSSEGEIGSMGSECEIVGIESEGGCHDDGTGFDETPSFQPPRRPPPPPLEVLPSEVSSTVKCSMEPLELDGLTLVKLGCGHGLPGIYACLEGAMAVHFQDFNAEVLRCLTIPNTTANLSQSSHSTKVSPVIEPEVRYFAGDWSQIHQCLPQVHNDKKDAENSSGKSLVYDYDVILMAETIYSLSAQQSLYELVKKVRLISSRSTVILLDVPLIANCFQLQRVKRPSGVIYMSAKKYYFGVGGGTRQFLSMVDKDGVMAASLVAEVADGSSNVREVWKLSMKSSPDS